LLIVLLVCFSVIAATPSLPSAVTLTEELLLAGDRELMGEELLDSAQGVAAFDTLYDD
jgi:hypothetical protein